MAFYSEWELTLQGPGLADYAVLVWDQGINGELKLPWKQVTEQQRNNRRKRMQNFARENVDGGLTIGIYKGHASDAVARNWMAALQVALAVYSGRSDLVLKLRIRGGDTYYIDNVVLAEAPSEMVSAGVARTLTTWKFLTGTWALNNEPAGPDPIGLDQALLNLARDGSLLNATPAEAAHLDALATWTNTGTAGDATQATGANRPTVLKGVGLYLSGASGNYFGFAHASALNTGTTFAVRVDCIIPDYTPAARVCLGSKWQTGGDQRSWALYLEPSGCVTLAISTDGTAATVTEWTSALPVNVAAGSFAGIGVRKNGTALSFSVFPALEWTGEIAFSPDQVMTNLDPFNSTAALIPGGTSNGTADLLAGVVQRIQWFNNSALWGANSPTAILDFTGQVASLAPAGTTVASSSDASRSVQLTVDGNPRFDGSNDSLSLATPLPLNAVNGITVAIYGMINVTTGTRALIFCGTPAGNPRLMLRVNAGNIELHVRRLDGETTAVISTALTGYNLKISASVDFIGGTGTIYLNGVPVVTGALTSSGGPCSATNSSETRIMAGQAGANPAAGDIYHVYLDDQATTIFEHADLWTTILAANA